MSSAEYILLHVVHVSAALMLFGMTFYAFAANPDRRGVVLSLSGIAALVMLLTGIRMWQAEYAFALRGWIIVKIVCWLGVAALTGIGFRRRNQTALLGVIALALGTLAVAMAYTKAF